ncbi:MAG TPA: DUF6364 family protein [Parafilimonas sp.]|nr:DUF6364 family protein [Parafilimonas sp.]
MTTKLNLTIEKNVAKEIKRYAEKKNLSVSKIAEDYFKKLVNKKKKLGESFINKHAGILNKYSDKTINDLEKVKQEYLKEKYGL